jgi:hypothetical protein
MLWAVNKFRGNLILAVACGLVLAAVVYLPFERVRIRPRILPQVASDGSLVVSLPDTTGLGEGPSAIVLRLRGGTEPAQIAIALNGTPVDRVTIPPGSEIRFDTAAHVPPGTGHRLALSADRVDWSLTYLELATVHGFSHGRIEFAILPRARRFESPHWSLSIALALGLLALRQRVTPLAYRVLRWTHRLVVVLVLALFGIAMLSSAVSRYRVVFAVHTFFLLVALVYADVLLAAAARISSGLLRVIRTAAPVAPHAALVAFILFSVVQTYRSDTGFTSLIGFGSEFEHRALPALRETPHVVHEGSGYDGQFYAQLALDPMVRNAVVATAFDAPGYRARRILLPWIAHVAGFGNPYWVLQVYALLNVCSWLALAWLLLRWLPIGAGRSTLAWLACLLGDGLLASLRLSLPDGPSMLALALAVAAIERNRQWIAAALLGLAGLTRETNLVGAAILGPYERPRKRMVVLTAIRAAAVAAPLVLWIVYLWSLGYPSTDAGTGNIGLPLTGFTNKWTLTIQEWASGSNPFAHLSLFALIALTTQSVFLATRRDWGNPWWRLGIAYVLFAVVVGDNVWGGHPGAISRIVIPVNIAFNIMLSRMTWTRFAPLWIVGNLNVIVGLDVIRGLYP